jgi:hypothetical protein
MNRTVSEIIEEIEGLVQAWPEAPAEVWDSLYEEFAEAVAREHVPRPPETRRGRTPTQYRRPTRR